MLSGCHFIFPRKGNFRIGLVEHNTLYVDVFGGVLNILSALIDPIGLRKCVTSTRNS